MGLLIKAVETFTKQYIPNSEDITTQELFKEFLSKKKKLKERVMKKVKKISNSTLHHKMNLNFETIYRLRNGDDLHFATLKRLDEQLNQDHSL